MNEKLMQDLLKKYPCDLIEDGLVYLNREIATGNRRLDLVFKDKRDRLLLVEAQIGSLDTKHIDRHIDFVEGFLEKYPDVDLRLMYVANKVDPLRKSFLEKRGYEYLEIPTIKFIELAKKHNIITENTNTEALSDNDLSIYQSKIAQEDNLKRDKFILYAKTIKEKEFWKLFFDEIDKRSFVKATFQASEFGVHIHNKNHFSSSGGKYSLMFTRNGCFKMNDTAFQGKSWNGLNRLKNWCTTVGLPDKFYSNLKDKNLLVGMELINIPSLVNSSPPQMLKEELFYCIDLFR